MQKQLYFVCLFNYTDSKVISIVTLQLLHNVTDFLIHKEQRSEQCRQANATNAKHVKARSQCAPLHYYFYLL
jgi:hypothetical protein